MRIAIWLLAMSTALSSCAPRPEPPGREAVSGEILWRVDVGGAVWTPLALADGALLFGTDEGTFQALDIATRKSRWRFSFGGRIRSAAEVTGELALFASDDGFLYAVALSSGEEKWRFDLRSADLDRRLPATGPPYEYDYRHSSPTLGKGVIYIGSADGNLYAVDVESGRERWRFATGDRIRSTPTVSGGRVYVGSWDGRVYALDASTGEEAWRFDTGNRVQGSPAVAAGRVVVGSRSAKLFCLDAGTGEEIWIHTHEDGSWVESSPVVVDGIVYVGSSDALELIAFDLATGEEIWHFATGGWSWGTPVVTDDAVYIGAISASPYYFEGVDLAAGFYQVERKTGRERWRMSPEPIEGYVTGGVFASPVILDGVVYVGALDGRIYAIAE